MANFLLALASLALSPFVPFASAVAAAVRISSIIGRCARARARLRHDDRVAFSVLGRHFAVRSPSLCRFARCSLCMLNSNALRIHGNRPIRPNYIILRNCLFSRCRRFLLSFNSVHIKREIIFRIESERRFRSAFRGRIDGFSKKSAFAGADRTQSERANCVN